MTTGAGPDGLRADGLRPDGLRADGLRADGRRADAAAVQVTVLTAPDCRFCEIALEVLARLGRDHPLLVHRIALDSPDGRALAARHGVAFAPGILFDGQMFSYGRLSERRLRRHLTRASP